jgi:poly(A) polymerase/tRNA nucleotidyltransferase (CCA-adding enzyme)
VTQAPLVNGRDLLSGFGLQPGPQVGILLEAVREAQAVGEIRTRDEAMALVSKLLEA